MREIQSFMEKFGYYYPRSDERVIPTSNEMKNFELQLGHQLPDDYKNFLIEYGRSSFSSYVAFPIQDDCPLGDFGFLDLWLGFSSDSRTYDIRHSLSTYSGRLPKSFLPIATDPGGNMICICLQRVRLGEIYFWNHNNEINQNMCFISKSFYKLFQLLYKYEGD